MNCSALTDTEYSIKVPIEEKMRRLDKLNKLDILDALQTEIKGLKKQHVSWNAIMRSWEILIGGEKKKPGSLRRENENLSETVTDLQYRSMSDNLVLIGIPEILGEHVEEQVKSFFQKELWLPKEETKNIILTHAQRLGKKRAFADVAASSTNSSTANYYQVQLQTLPTHKDSETKAQR